MGTTEHTGTVPSSPLAVRKITASQLCPTKTYIRAKIGLLAPGLI